MNKFLTFPGTQPVYLGDIDFMQDAARAAFSLLFRGLIDSDSNSLNAILQGVDVTILSVDQIQYSAGVVVLNGEILPVEGDTISISSSAPLYLHVNSVLSGSRTFKDGNSHDCYDTRTAYVNGVSEGGVALSSLPRLFHHVKDVSHSTASTTGKVDIGVLTRKNNFWFFGASFSWAGGTSNLNGSASFNADNGLTLEEYNSIEETEFPCLIKVAGLSIYSQASCQITKNDETMTVLVSIVDSTSITTEEAAQVATMNAMIIPNS